MSDPADGDPKGGPAEGGGGVESGGVESGGDMEGGGTLDGDGPLRTAQVAAVWMAGVFGLLGFLASVGARVLPAGAPGLVWLLHPLLAVFGAAGAYAAALRGREIDRWRWRMVEDPRITSGEREEAHKEAERQRRTAATTFLAAPVFLGYWFVYQVDGGLAVWLLPASALVGYALGFAVAQRRVPEEPWG